MKKSYGLAVLLFALCVGSVQAAEVTTIPSADPGTFETTVITQSQVVSGLGAGSIIYGIDVVATTAGAYCAAYDVSSASSASLTQGVAIDEISEATQHDRESSRWVAPYRLTTGLYVAVTNGRCIIYHNPM
jgi:hypothetical protein